MSVTDVLIRSITGYVFVVPGLILYFLCLKKSEKKQTSIHIATAFVFCYYLIGILTMTGIGRLKSFSPRIVLIPFMDMLGGPIDTILNVVLFIPLGFFLPLLYQKYNRISSVALTGFLFSLSIEMIQMFGRGSTDINDLITNTVGTILGYFTYKLFFIAYSLVIMVTIQPLVISRLFKLG